MQLRALIISLTMAASALPLLSVNPEASSVNVNTAKHTDETMTPVEIAKRVNESEPSIDIAKRINEVEASVDIAKCASRTRKRLCSV